MIQRQQVNVSVIMPRALHDRLIRQAAKESVDRGRRVTPSHILRWALEDYLDAWETAVYVPDPAPDPSAGPTSNTQTQGAACEDRPKEPTPAREP